MDNLNSFLKAKAQHNLQNVTTVTGAKENAVIYTALGGDGYNTVTLKELENIFKCSCRSNNFKSEIVKHFNNFKVYNTSTCAGASEFIDKWTLESPMQPMSMAKAKVEPCHDTGNKENQKRTYVKSGLQNFVFDEVKHINKIKYNDCYLQEVVNIYKNEIIKSPYIQKTCFDYKQDLNMLILKGIEEFGMQYCQVRQYHMAWNTDMGKRAETSKMIVFNGLYTPLCTIEQIIKKWCRLNKVDCMPYIEKFRDKMGV